MYETFGDWTAFKDISLEFEYKDPKSSNGIRTIVVPDYLMDLLKNIKKTKPKKKRNKKDAEPRTVKKEEIKLDITHEIFAQNPHSFTKK